MTSRPLDRQILARAFALLDLELARTRTRAAVTLAGGAVMALLYDAERVTRDVDGVITQGHGPLLEAADVVGAELQLPRGWLNEGVSAYLSGAGAGEIAVFDGRWLVVSAVSARHMVALKARRAWPQDLADLRTLVAAVDIRDASDILRIVDELFPDDPISDRAAAAVTDAFPPP